MHDIKYQKVTAVVAAYNEAKTIARVLKSIKKCKYINQIVVVDDGSKDKTYELAKKFATNVIRHKKNQGKSEAIISAIPKVENKIVFLCDADLINLTSDICEQIIEPVAKGDADMSIGMRNYGIFNRIAYFHPSISGERAISINTLKQGIKSAHFHNWGMELVLDYYCKTHNLKTVQRPYPYNHTPQVDKRGLISGLGEVINQAVILVKVFAAIKFKGWR